jgi:hypothetical protein
MRGRGAVTSDDVRRQAAEKLGEYSADLAYIYGNSGKII